MFMRLAGIAFLLLIVLPLTSTAQTLPLSQPALSFPTGVTFFPLTGTISTTFVEGQTNLTYLHIGESYISGQPFTYGNASLQLNAMLNGSFWAQDVMLFHQTSNDTFTVTLVINFWNLTGPFTALHSNTTTFRNLGVYCYQGPTFNVTLPVSLALFMNSSGGLSFGYSLNGDRKVFLTLPFSGQFRLGGLSIAGLPNDLELVWGGPGGGSVVDMSAVGFAELYFLNATKLNIVPSALSVGLDTAESAYGVVVTPDLQDIKLPFALINRGVNSPSVLWPVPPTISTVQRNTTVKVTLQYGNYTFSNQEVEILVPHGLGLKEEYVGLTNSSGEVTFFNVTQPLYVVYFPGNYSLSESYAVSSPQLNKLISSVSSEFRSLVDFLKSYNFSKALSSDFQHVKYKQPKTETNYLLLEVIAGFSIGLIASAVFIRRSS
jgi:hypothetical protein